VARPARVGVESPFVPRDALHALLNFDLETHKAWRASRQGRQHDFASGNPFTNSAREAL
jgi:hypothetical protein